MAGPYKCHDAGDLGARINNTNVHARLAAVFDGLAASGPPTTRKVGEFTLDDGSMWDVFALKPHLPGTNFLFETVADAADTEAQAEGRTRIFFAPVMMIARLEKAKELYWVDVWSGGGPYRRLEFVRACAEYLQELKDSAIVTVS